MNRNFCVLAFVVGGLAIAWVGAGYAVSNPLALAMTLLIAAFYGMGGLELRRFHQATATLVQALGAMAQPPPSLAPWLNTIHPALQNTVRLRIEGERAGLPGPAMTPYLVGLLVLLGMLGTFLGMVVTLNGAVMALETTTDLPTIRAALAAPIKGLGLAFGTSVAGVAASAMLGLVSALCRRDRLQAGQWLDARIANDLRGFSLAHQRQETGQETLKTLQLQTQVMPQMVAQLTSQLQAMVGQMAHQGQALQAHLLAGQDSFHRQTTSVYSQLASSVDQSLKDSLSASARLAGASLQPVVEATMAGITRETSALHEKIADAVQLQLQGLSAQFGSAVGTVAEVWTGALSKHQRSSDAMQQGLQTTLAQVSETFAQRAASLLVSVEHAHAGLQSGLATADEQRQAAAGQALQALAQTLQQQWQQAGTQQLNQQAQICQTLEQTAAAIHRQAEAHAQQTMREIAGLMQAAAEAPRAAADMTVMLRQQLSDSMARDNTLLDERSRIMAALGSLLQAAQDGSTAQRAAVDGLVASSASVLQQLSTRFTTQVEAESGKLVSAAVQLTGSAVEVASLGESFGVAVQQFSASNEALMRQLQRIEAAMGKSTTRSDEQLAYFVAQAREIIDLSILSQRQIVEDLQQLASRRATPAGEVA